MVAPSAFGGGTEPLITATHADNGWYNTGKLLNFHDRWSTLPVHCPWLSRDGLGQTLSHRVRFVFGGTRLLAARRDRPRSRLARL